MYKLFFWSFPYYLISQFYNSDIFATVAAEAAARKKKKKKKKKKRLIKRIK